MKTNVTFNQIATELVNIFSNEARVTEYNAQGGTMRQGVCGWCGIMSPVNRLAFVEDFGAQTVTLAEVEARRRMADKAKEYAATHHAAHVAEANQNEQSNAAPVAGSFVWAVETGLKNEGQGVAGVIADAVEGYDVRRRLVCVERVINATAADFLRPSLADELVKAAAEKGEEFPGGSRNDDENFTDFFDNYKTWYTVAAAGVVFRASKANRDRLHIWQNEQSRKERAAILGEGWQYIEGLNTGTEPGDVVTCIDGTRGRVTKSAPESCCIEFETEGGQRLSVAGYFRKESPRYRASEKSPISEKQETGTIDTPITYDAQHYREVLTADYWGEHAPRVFQFDGDEIEIYAPTDRRPSWILVTDIFSSPKEATLDEVADYLAARYQETHKPMLQDSEEIKADVFRNGLTEEQSGKLTAKLSQWARMTDENNHTEARVSIAKFFGLTFQTDFKELQEKSYKQGYLTMSDRETSCQLTTRMLGAIERNYSQGIADRVRNCL